MNIYFTSLAALVSAIFIASLGIYIFFKDKGSKLSQVFALTTFSFTIWLFGTYKMLIAGSIGDDFSAILWDRFIYIGVVFIPALLYHFSIIFTKETKQKNLSILSYILSVIFLFISRTDYFVSGLFKYEWGVHTQAKLFHHIFLAFFFTFVILSLKNLYLYYSRKDITQIEKIQTQYIFLAFFLLVGIGSLGYMPAYNIGIYPFSFYSGLIFSIIVAYTILKYNFFNLKIVATELITIAILLFSVIQIRLAKSTNELLIQIIFLIIFMIFGILLIRSVNEEVKRREEIQKLADNLTKATDKLKTANARLKELDQFKNDFISIASHQMKTPLTSIKGLLSMILEGFWVKKPRQEKEELAKVYASTQQLINLVDTLLNISRIETGRMAFNFEIADIAQIVTNIMSDLAPLIKAKNLDLSFTTEPLPKISVDSLTIRQVIMNLIDNAIKYTPEGKITIELKQENDKIVFKITDTGIGFSKEQSRQFFEKFYRTTDGVKTNTKGSGVGLYAASEIIKAHHGKVGAESAGVDKGSTFWFEIPMK